MNVYHRSTRMILAVTLLCLIGAAVTVQQIMAHGSMRVPLSREYNCFLEGPENPQTEACKAAIAVAGTQQFYDWNGINRMDADDRHREIIPDGELCSGGKESHRGLNLARDDWATQVVAPESDGSFEFVYEATAPHASRYFEFYVTKDGYDPAEPLKWSDLEDDPFCHITEVELENGQYRMRCPMPLEKEGKHLIYNIWQRNDSPEAFYSCMDVTFDYSGIVATPPAAPPTDTPQPTTAPSEWSCRVDYEVIADWGAGFNANVTLTNLSDTTIDGWTVRWDFPGEQVITEAWSGSFQQAGQGVSIQNAEWNGTIAPDASVGFGFGATVQGRNEAPVNFSLNGQACNGQAPPAESSPTPATPTASPVIEPTAPPVATITPTVTPVPTEKPPSASPTAVEPTATPTGAATLPAPTPTSTLSATIPDCGAPHRRAILENGGALVYLPSINRGAADLSGLSNESAIACAVAYQIDSQWESGFAANITVTNTGDEAVRGDDLRWTFTEGEEIGYGWDAVFDQTDDEVAACNTADHWNGVIGANGENQITIGFVADHSGPVSIPTGFTLNGTDCTVNGGETSSGGQGGP